MVKVAARPAAARNDGDFLTIRRTFWRFFDNCARFLTVLAVILRDYCVICLPANPRCTTVRLRLTGRLSLVLAQNSVLKGPSGRKIFINISFSVTAKYIVGLCCAQKN